MSYCEETIRNVREIPNLTLSERSEEKPPRSGDKDIRCSLALQKKPTKFYLETMTLENLILRGTEKYFI